MKCSICENAYDTRHVCESCRADPANDGWVEGEEEPTEYADRAASSARVPWGEGERWTPSAFTREVAKRIHDGHSLRAVAKLLGCTLKAVRVAVRELSRYES